MKEQLLNLKDKALAFWQERSKSQKGILIGSVAVFFLIIIGLSFVTFNTKYVPLYTNLSVQEIGQIKGELDARGVSYDIVDGGTTIKVPEDQANSLLVELAGQGIPKSGHIDYSFFSQNASWGITENEFNMMKLDAMQTELANLIKSIEGIEDAQVMITLPQESVFVSDTADTASASIVIHTQPGFQFKGNQIESLYHLVSKAVPNLPEENIVIRNQYLEYFDKESYASGPYGDYTYQQSIKNDIERDIQRRLQHMLGAMVGMDNVIVSVTADIDFTQENRVEELVDPVDLENMEGLPVSIETIHETYSGNPQVGGVAGTGDEDIPNYQGIVGDGDGEYELVKETINNEFNRIRRDIVESPYKVRDLGIQVVVDNVTGVEGDQIQYLTQAEQNSVEEGIASILNSVITTSIDKGYGEVNPEEKISIVFQEFSTGQPTPGVGPVIPTWLYAVGGALLLIVIILIILLIRQRRKQAEDEADDIFDEQAPTEIPELTLDGESEADIRRKQLEKMAMEKPEDFAKLLRSWISND